MTKDARRDPFSRHDFAQEGEEKQFDAGWPVADSIGATEAKNA